jgi:3D (Asp-Asp-Asp) domain-containing protein
MQRDLRLLLIGTRRFLRGCWSFAWWTTEGLRDRRARGTGLRLLALGLVLGTVIGWSNGKVIHIITETELPKPVTAPPPGQTWARVLTTGYCPCWRCCGLSADGITAINRRIREYPHGIAADSQLVPYRTSLSVPGYGIANVDDTGGAMRQDARRGRLHLDLRFVSHDQAARWGRRWMWIAVPVDCGGAKLPYAEPTRPQ